MVTQAQYNAEGQITGMLSPKEITDTEQIAALNERGINLVIIPDGMSAITGRIVDGAYWDYYQ